MEINPHTENAYDEELLLGLDQKSIIQSIEKGQKLVKLSVNQIEKNPNHEISNIIEIMTRNSSHHSSAGEDDEFYKSSI